MWFHLKILPSIHTHPDTVQSLCRFLVILAFLKLCQAKRKQLAENDNDDQLFYGLVLHHGFETQAHRMCMGDFRLVILGHDPGQGHGEG